MSRDAGFREQGCGSDDRGLLIVANSVAIATLVPVVLHQAGVIKRLPDPPMGLFDSDRITGSRMAHPFGIPDGLLGLASYGTTLLLTLMAFKSRRANRALGAKLLLDGGVATFNTARQVVRFGRLCSWCMGTVVSTAVMVYAGRKFLARAFSTR